MAAYYNDNEPYVAQWLRNLIAAGHLPEGDVDERSLGDVRPDDLRGYTQCHFFAGIGGWASALRMAGWPDDRPVWTGSCPCQPFSAAGKQEGFDDPRHLWPTWFKLIRKCNPPVVFGEQVAAAIGGGWLDAVFSDLEGQGYACGAAVLPACGVGAPHIRQRLWFVADADAPGRGLERSGGLLDGEREAFGDDADGCCTGGVANAHGRHPSPEGLQRGGEHGQRAEDGRAGELGDASSARLQERERDGRIQREALEPSAGQAAIGRSNAGIMGDAPSPRSSSEPQGRIHGGLSDGLGQRGTVSFWSDCDWLPCTDGKARPVEPGSFPLAHGIPNRVGRVRACGNAIVRQVAEEFILAFVET